MDLETISVVAMIGTFIVLLFSGYPVAFVLAGTGILFAVLGEMLKGYGIYLGVDVNFLGLVVNRIWSIMSNSSLVAVSLFILMGYILERGGIAHRLMTVLRQLLSRTPGGLALAVIFIGVILAASTGVIGASLILLCTLAMKPMLDAGYRPQLATGSIAAAGCLGILIPPSIMLIVMGDQMQLSVGDLFMAAVVPGLILAALYASYVIGYALLDPSVAPPEPTDRRRQEISIAIVLDVVKALVAPVLLIVAVLGSIFLGVATPSEAAGIGALGAAILVIANGQMSLKTLISVALDTTRTTSFVFGIFIGATCFAVVLRGVGGDRVIGGALVGLPLDATGVVIFIMVIIFLLGFFLDWIEISLIVLPLVRPVIDALGIDRLWFTILVAVCLQTSFLTPPMGPALFYVKSLAPPTIRLMQVYGGVTPYCILQLIALGLLIGFPELVTWLPQLAYPVR